MNDTEYDLEYVSMVTNMYFNLPNGGLYVISLSQMILGENSSFISLVRLRGINCRNGRGELFCNPPKRKELRRSSPFN